MADATLRKGHHRTILSFEWIWVAPDGATRGHWRATDGTEITISPPSGGNEAWEVFLPKNGEMLVRAEGPEVAFRYAATERLRRAN